MPEVDRNSANVIDLFRTEKCCVIIPTYNNDKTLAKVIDDTLEHTNQIIVVNDGSTDNTKLILNKYINIIQILDLPTNHGKGYAIRLAFKLAYKEGYKYAITIDSDCQHKTEDYPKFLEKLIEEPNSVIIGSRNMEQKSVPGKSNFGRKFSNFWFKIETGLQINDTQSGYRLYPLEILDGMKFFTNRYEFEIEVIVRLAWKGCKIVSIPVQVYYAPKEERISHFRPFIDFTRISFLNTLLVTLALLFFRPLLFFRKLKRFGYKKFIKENFINAQDSNKKLSISVAIGILCGILPIWGYQMLMALTLAYFFRLNKIISVAVSNISIPPVIPFILYSSYITGTMLIGNGSNALASTTQIDSDLYKEYLQQYIVGSIVLAVVLSILVGSTTYILLSIFRKNKAIKSSGI